jgi:hypothetical protein
MEPTARGARFELYFKPLPLRMDNTLAALARLGIAMPPIDERLLGACQRAEPDLPRMETA